MKKMIKIIVECVKFLLFMFGTSILVVLYVCMRPVLLIPSFLLKLFGKMLEDMADKSEDGFDFLLKKMVPYSVINYLSECLED